MKHQNTFRMLIKRLLLSTFFVVAFFLFSFSKTFAISSLGPISPIGSIIETGGSLIQIYKDHVLPAPKVLPQNREIRAIEINKKTDTVPKKIVKNTSKIPPPQTPKLNLATSVKIIATDLSANVKGATSSLGDIYKKVINKIPTLQANVVSSFFDTYYENYTSELAKILYGEKSPTPLPLVTGVIKKTQPPPPSLSNTETTPKALSGNTTDTISTTTAPSSQKIVYVPVPGPQGPPGTTGATGPVGPQGPAGTSGGFAPLAPPSWAPPPQNSTSQVLGNSAGFASLGAQDLNANTLIVTGNSTLASLTTTGATINGNITVTGSITGSGAVNPGLTVGSVFFQGTSGIAQDNTNLFWDDTTNALGLGTATPAATAILDLTSTGKGFLGPRMTEVQRDAITSPATGLLIYNTTSNTLNVYNGTTWGAVGGSGLTIGTTTITSGTTGRVLYDNAGVVGEMTTTGSGTVLALATSPTLVTPVLGVATATSLNGLTITSSTGTLTVANSKTLTASNTLTFTGTDGSTLNIGTGGTLGTNAYTSTAYAPLASPTFTGTVTIPTPFTLGATSVTSTGTQLNYLNAATGTTGTASTNLVFSTSPTLVTPALGTPSALVLTNATGLPAAAVLAGSFGTGAYVMDTSLRVPLVIGSTSTTGDLSLQTTSGVGASGADMHFLVGNNGATEAITILNSGNVGINQTAPLLKLDVGGSGRFTGASTSVLTGTIDPAASTTVTGVSTLFTTELVVGDRITVTGETRTVTAIASNTSLTVDSAFTDGANDTSPDKLAAIFVAQTSASAAKLVVNDLGSVVQDVSSTTAMKLQDGSGNPVLTVDTTQTTGSGIDITANGSQSVNLFNIYQSDGATNYMAVGSTGNLGMGDSTPDYLLELYDTTNTPAFALSDDDIAHGVTTVAQTDVFFHLSSISTTVGGAVLTGLADATGVALKLNGIQSSDPTDTTPAISLIGNKASGTGVVDLGAAETVFQVANNDDTAAITIIGSGSVGVGTTVPGKALEINSATGADLRLTYNDSDGSAANYTDFSVSSVGSLTIAPTGTNPSISLTPGGTGSLLIASGATTGTTTTSGLSLSANSLTTGTGLYIASSSITSGLLVDLQVSGTVAAASQTALNILTAGANGTAGITTYGGQISNTHTNATSGTNVALYLNASGATTANYGLIVNAGRVGIGLTAPLLQVDVAGSGRFTGAATSVLTGTIDPAASTTVTGVSTLFTTELVVGDRITVTGETRTVTAIASNTSLTVDSAFTDGANDTTPDKLAAIFVARDSSNAVQMVLNDSGGLTVNNGAILHDIVTGQTSIDNLALGNMTFDTDPGVVSWADMSVTSSASVSTIESYTAAIDGNSLLTLYATSDGAGSIKNSAVGIGTTAPLLRLDVAGSVRLTEAATSVLTGTIDAAASTTITGVGTLFTTELVIGDRITVTGETRTVTAIASDTSLTVDTATTDTANDTSPDKLAAEFIVRDSANNLDLILQDSGNLGIGDVSPDYLLELYDVTNTPAFALSDDDVAHGVTTVAETEVFAHLSSISTTVGGAVLTGLADATGVALKLNGIQSSDPTDTTPAISLIGNKASGTGVVDLGAAETVFQVANNDDAAALSITGDGGIAFPAEAGSNANDYVCIATTTGAISSKATACTGSSSLRYKKDIEDLVLGLDAVLQMRPVSFDWKQEYIINPHAPRQIGFIAEEMEQISPLFVTYENGQVEGVEYMKLTSVLAKAIQELDLKINDLQVNAIGTDTGSIWNSILEKIENGVGYMKALVIETLKVGSSAKRTGITLYDEVTGEPYCISVANGAQKTTPGECAIIEPVSPAPNPEPEPETIQPSPEMIPSPETIPELEVTPEPESTPPESEVTPPSETTPPPTPEPTP